MTIYIVHSDAPEDTFHRKLEAAVKEAARRWNTGHSGIQIIDQTTRRSIACGAQPITWAEAHRALHPELWTPPAPERTN